MTLGMKTLRGASVMVSSQLIAQLVRLASTVILARLLMPSDFGILAIMVGVKEVVGLVLSFGPGSYLIREADIDERKYNTAFTINVIRGLLMALAIAALAYPVSVFLENEKLMPILLAGSLGSVCIGFVNPGLLMHSKNMNFAPLAKVLLYNALSTVLVTIALALIIESYWALVIGSIWGSVSEVLFSYLMHKFRPKFSLYGVREMFSFTVWVSLGSFPVALATRVDTFVLERFVGTAAVGIFSTAKSFAQMPNTILLSVSQKVFYSTFSAVREGKQREAYVYMELIGTIIAILAPLMVGFALCAAETVPLVFGEKWLAMIPLVQFLPIFFLAQLIVNNAHSQVLKDGRTKLLTVRGFALLAIRAPLLITGGIHYGFNGVVGGFLLSGLLMILFDIWLVRTVLPVRVADYLSRLWRPVLSVSAMAAACLGIPQLLNIDTGILSLAIKMVVGAAVYPAVSFALWKLSGSPQGPERRIVNLTEMALAKRKRRKA